MEGDFMKKRIYLLMLTALIGLSCCACGQDGTLQAELSSLPGVSLQLENIESQPAEQDDSVSAESSQVAAPTSQAEADPPAPSEQPAPAESKIPSASSTGTETKCNPPASASTPSNTASAAEPEPLTTPQPSSDPAPSKQPETPPTSEPEETPEPSQPEQPQQPKSDYEYPFNIDQIRLDCIEIAKGYGLTLDTSLHKGNSSWANPVTASQNTQNDLLKRQLQESIMYYADDEYRESMELSPLNLTVFNIYCEPAGNGAYTIYFLR